MANILAQTNDMDRERKQELFSKRRSKSSRAFLGLLEPRSRISDYLDGSLEEV